MNPPTIKNLNLRSIYTVLAIGFALLLFLIGLIGVGSSSKLNQISVSAGKSADDYMERLTLALNIREAAAEPGFAGGVVVPGAVRLLEHVRVVTAKPVDLLGEPNVGPGHQILVALVP